MKITRKFDQPNFETFTIPTIKELLRYHLMDREIIVDPFARNSNTGTISNDLNPNTTAMYHMEAQDFCHMLLDQGIEADAILFDPPYSRRQMKEMYEGIGLKFTMEHSQQFLAWNRVKTPLSKICKINGKAISFGWNSAGMGRKRGFKIEEILLLHHGERRYDTICVVETKISEQLEFSVASQEA